MAIQWSPGLDGIGEQPARWTRCCTSVLLDRYRLRCVRLRRSDSLQSQVAETPLSAHLVANRYVDISPSAASSAYVDVKLLRTLDTQSKVKSGCRAPYHTIPWQYPLKSGSVHRVVSIRPSLCENERFITHTTTLLPAWTATCHKSRDLLRI